MEYKEAKELAGKVLGNEFGNESFDVIIDERYSFEFSRGWFFQYNTSQFVLHNDDINCLFVTSPIIIDKIDGRISRLKGKINLVTTAEFYIKKYLESKDKNLVSKYFQTSSLVSKG